MYLNAGSIQVEPIMNPNWTSTSGFSYILNKPFVGLSADFVVKNDNLELANKPFTEVDTQYLTVVDGKLTVNIDAIKSAIDELNEPPAEETPEEPPAEETPTEPEA